MKKESPAGQPGKTNNCISNIGGKANKTLHKCFECEGAIMKLIDNKVVQYCSVYTIPCQDAIKICVVV